MRLPEPYVIAIAFLLFEATISLTRRPLPDAQAKDRGTFQLIWIVITLAIVLGIWAGLAVPSARLPAVEAIYPYGFALFVFGAIVRAWSIWTLGKFFTVQVAIASDHKLIENGPYRLLRHPSYTGSLMMFVGYLLCQGNALTMAIVLLAVLAVFIRQKRGQRTIPFESGRFPTTISSLSDQPACDQGASWRQPRSKAIACAVLVWNCPESRCI